MGIVLKKQDNTCHLPLLFLLKTSFKFQSSSSPKTHWPWSSQSTVVSRISYKWVNQDVSIAWTIFCFSIPLKNPCILCWCLIHGCMFHHVYWFLWEMYLNLLHEAPEFSANWTPITFGMEFAFSYWTETELQFEGWSLLGCNAKQSGESDGMGDHIISEMLGFRQTTQCYSSEDHTVVNHHCENLKCHFQFAQAVMEDGQNKWSTHCILRQSQIHLNTCPAWPGLHLLTHLFISHFHWPTKMKIIFSGFSIPFELFRWIFCLASWTFSITIHSQYLFANSHRSVPFHVRHLMNHCCNFKNSIFTCSKVDLDCGPIRSFKWAELELHRTCKMCQMRLQLLLS